MNDHSLIIKNTNNTISSRFGFFGLGMGGSSIAAACGEITTNVKNDRYPYTALLVNTNKMDLDKIETRNPNIKKMVIGNGKGAGRDLELGEQMFKESAAEITKEIETRFQNSNFIWIVAGLGGGTGTGSVIEAIKLLMMNGFNKRFGLILTLPRSNEGQTVLNNALQRLQMINKAMQGLGSIILVDNQKLYNDFSEKNPLASIAEYLQFSNRFVAETLHEINVVTASFKPFGENHFDSSEFENLIKTPGVLHFARFTTKSNEIDSAQFLSHAGRLKEQIEDGVLSDGYDLTDTKRLAVSVLANQPTAKRLFNFQFTNSIEDELNKIAPLANEKPVAEYVYENNETSLVCFYAAFAGLELPKRVSELVQENARLIELQNSKQKGKDIFAGLEISSKPKTSSQELSFEDLFGSSNQDQDEKNSITEQDVMNNLFK